ASSPSCLPSSPLSARFSGSRSPKVTRPPAGSSPTSPASSTSSASSTHSRAWTRVSWNRGTRLAPELARSPSSRSLPPGCAEAPAFGIMAGVSVAAPTTAPVAPVEVDRPSDEDVVRPDRPWLVIVWNDPINLMSYVTYVFQKLFGYSFQKATRLMLQVHHEGKAIVSDGNREKAEADVARLPAHALWAPMEHPS